MLFDAPRFPLQNGIFGFSISNRSPYPTGPFNRGQNFWYTLSTLTLFLDIWGYMGELRSYCTVWRKKSKKVKVNMKKIRVVHSIELYQLYINQVFSQLSAFSFRKKSIFLCFSMINTTYCMVIDERKARPLSAVWGKKSTQ